MSTNNTVDFSNIPNTSESSCYPPVSSPIIAFFVSHFTLLLGLFGIPLNVLVLVVLRMDKSKTTTRFLLIVLAIQDLILIHFYMVFYVVNHYTDLFRVAELSQMRHADSFLLFIIQWTKMAESYTIVLVSADRFIAIRRPLEAARKCTVARVSKCLVVIVIVTCLIKLPNLILDYKKAVAEGNCTFLLTQAVFADAYWYEDYSLFYQQIFDQITSVVIPLVLLLVLNVCLIMHVRQSAVVRNTYLLEGSAARSPARDSGENQISTRNTPEPQLRREQGPANKRPAAGGSQRSITFTLIGVITAFVVCELPTTFHFCLFVYAMKMQTNVGNLSITLYNYVLMVPLLVINCSFNFFIYVLTGRKFRRLCLRALRIMFLRLKYKCCPCISQENPYTHDENQFQMTQTCNYRNTYLQHSSLSNPGLLSAPPYSKRRYSNDSNY